MSQKIETDIAKMIECLQNTLEDALKFDAGNASAGTRVRKALQEVAVGCKTARAAVSQISKDRKAGE